VHDAVLHHRYHIYDGGTVVQLTKRNYDANVRSKAFRANDFVWYYYP
jgi:hypothetical protein